MNMKRLFLLAWSIVCLAGTFPAHAQSPWSSATPVGGGWKWLGWFGYFTDSQSPWIYHQEHGWSYGIGTLDDLYLYDRQMGWLWTSQTMYPWMHKFNESAWVWYKKPSSPRWFYNARTGQWYSPSGGRNNTGYTVLFSDIFTVFSDSKWTHTGSPELNRAVGYPASPAIGLDHDDSITAFASGWATVGGLQTCIRIYDADDARHEIELYSDAGTYPRARVSIFTSVFTYRVELAGVADAMYSAQESLTGAYANKRWFDLSFTIHANGSSEWARDGVRMLYVPAPFPASNLKLRIRSARDYAPEVLFDDVLVRKPL